MSADRLTRILGLLRAGSDKTPGTRRICDLAAQLSGSDGAGIMLLSGEVVRGSLCATTPVAELIEDLQYTLGEGPCIDAHHFGNVVSEPFLEVMGGTRWPAFTPPIIARGARAVFGFPLRVGVVRLGALDLYRCEPGPLSTDEHANALVMSGVAARAILGMQADAAPGAIADEVEAEANFQFAVHQASGMVSVQLDISVAEALVRLRAHAFRTDRLVADVARDVVGRRLRFDDLPDS